MCMGLAGADERVAGERWAPVYDVAGSAGEEVVVALTDMLGARKLVPGTLKSVDLTSNVILIEPRESAQ